MVAWAWCVELVRRVDPRVGFGSGFCGPFPRMARGFGAPRGRRVERVPIRLANTTDAAFEICHADALAWPGGAPQRRCEQVINYKSLYFEVIDNIVGMIENRFRNVESFSFLDLVNPKIFPQLVDGVPVDKIQQFIEKYGTLFNIPNLQSQLAFVYKDKDFHKDNSVELLKYIHKVNVQTCIPEMVKLLKLNAVMAVSSASAERSFSCLGRVKSYLRSTMADLRLGSLCRISTQRYLERKGK